MVCANAHVKSVVICLYCHLIFQSITMLKTSSALPCSLKIKFFFKTKHAEGKRFCISSRHCNIFTGNHINLKNQKKNNRFYIVPRPFCWTAKLKDQSNKIHPIQTQSQAQTSATRSSCLRNTTGTDVHGNIPSSVTSTVMCRDLVTSYIRLRRLGAGAALLLLLSPAVVNKTDGWLCRPLAMSSLPRAVRNSKYER